MRKPITLALCCMLVSVGFIWGGETEPARNGTSWMNLSYPQKAVYAAGFVDGYAGGFNDGAAVTVEKYLSPEPPKLTEAQKEGATEQAANAVTHARVILRSKATRAEVLNAMVAFYGDDKNTPVCWADALLFSVASLAGRTPTEQQLDAVRAAGTKSGCK
jgi:hypothetical protein